MPDSKITYRPVIRMASILFLLIIGFQIFNNIAWQHMHVMPDGTLVTHAHPYNKSADNTPAKQHHHTAAEMLILENLEILFPLVFLTIGFFALYKNENLPILHVEFVHIKRAYSAYGRAPPAFQ